MIRGFVALVGNESPLPEIPAPTAMYRKTAVKFSTVEPNCDEDEKRYYLNVEGTKYCLEVKQNIRGVYTDLNRGTNGLMRVSFIRPKLELVIFSSRKDIKTFAKVVQILSKLPTIKRTWRQRDNYFSQPNELYGDECNEGWPRDSGDVNHAFTEEGNSLLRKTIAGYQFRMLKGMTLQSCPFLMILKADGNMLMEIPKHLGLFPCLTTVHLADNLLGYATSWKWLTTTIMRKSLGALYLDRNNLSRIPDEIFDLKSLAILSISGNSLTELPAKMGKLKLRNLHVHDNKLKILPAWMYRKERLFSLSLKGNPFDCGKINKTQKLNPKDFEPFVVPSLFQTIARFIVADRFPFWEYNIPQRLMSYLEGAYYCRCRSIILHDVIGRVVQCYVMGNILATACDVSAVPITIHCCSYNCYTQLQPLFMFYSSLNTLDSILEHFREVPY